MNSHQLSVVTPIYNEEDIIVSATLLNIATLENYKIDYEIILVNDGSTDSSLALINAAFSARPNIIIKNLERNLGMGGAVREGIKLVNKEYIICVPADSPLDDETFNCFTQNIGKADVLVSYRKARLGYSFRMLVNSFVFHFLISTLFSINLKDYNWIHLYHRKIFDKGKISIESNGLFMLAEILIKAHRLDYSFFEFEVNQQQRLTGIATASKISSILKTMHEMLMLRWRI